MTEKIEYLKQEYIGALNVAKIRHYPGVLKCLVVGTASLVENLAKFRLRDLAEGVFKIAESKGHLLEAERNAPGRELSYLVEAKPIDTLIQVLSSLSSSRRSLRAGHLDAEKLKCIPRRALSGRASKGYEW